MAISENSKKVFKYLQSVIGQDVTSADVAEAIGLEKRTVDGAFTSSIQKKGYGTRVEAEVELEDGRHQAIKLLTLNDTGRAVDVDTL